MPLIICKYSRSAHLRTFRAHFDAFQQPPAQQRRPVEVRDKDRQQAIKEQGIATIVLCIGLVMAMVGYAEPTGIKGFDDTMAGVGLMGLILGFLCFLVGRAKV